MPDPQNTQAALPANDNLQAVSQPSALPAPPSNASSEPLIPASMSGSSGQNTSGMGSGAQLPPGIDGWGWGPFLLNWIWAIGNGVWIGLLALVPYVGFVMAIILGIKGREWAWQKKKWGSVEHFNRVQHKWSIAGLIVAAFSLLVIPIILVLIVIVAINPVGRLNQAESDNLTNSEVRSVGSAVYDCITDQISKGTPANTIYSDIELDLVTGKGGCANSTNLINGDYLSTFPSGVEIASTNVKVCVYKATSGSSSDYASYDSSEGIVATVPNGTSDCI
ncbi:hypothetical protein IID23_04695 [Patescibacteria group bacterium]|nr:hypothetical protein [Patescibacteria group bacterium]